jgi:hypothetical protein
MTAPELDALVDVAAKFNPDFDDAYQYSAARRHWAKDPGETLFLRRWRRGAWPVQKKAKYRAKSGKCP